MKKHLLLFVLAFAATNLLAQHREMYSLVYQDSTGYYYEIHNAMQQRDGDQIIDIYLFEGAGIDDIVPLGKMYYKMSSANHAITDSLFVADTARHAALLARDPRGEGNIRAAFEYHEECDSTFVRISWFPDDNLQGNPEVDIVVPICEGDVWSSIDGSLIDCDDDLVMTYYKPLSEINSDQYVVRIGLDGTLKHQALLNESLFCNPRSLRTLKKSPLQYYQWHYLTNLYNNDNNLAIDVIDSTFNKSTVTFNRILNRELIAAHPYDTMLNLYAYEHLVFSYDTEVIPADGNDVLVAAQYIYDTNFYAWTQDCGVAVAKYDLGTGQLKNYAVFNDNHDYYSTSRPMGLKMLGDGTVYFMYKEYGCYPDESVIIVKMDANLIVEWKRFCKTDNINMIPPLNSPIVFEDETMNEKAIAWSGYARKNGNYDKLGWVCFFLNHEGTVSAIDTDMKVRPYNYYPNPVRNELHLEYSPDVTPSQIELYDLQGRLVKTQRTGLESLNLQGLPAGTYTMRVTLDGGKVFSDKVVKE